MVSCSTGDQTFHKHKRPPLNLDGAGINNLYIHSCFQNYWQNHERIRAWLIAMERHYEKSDVQRNWHWQMALSQMYWAASYMHWWYGDALGVAASSSLVSRFPETSSTPAENVTKSSTSRKRSRRASKRRRSSRHKHKCSARHQLSEASNYNMEVGDDNECDNDVFEFEMSEELLEFFKQTAEHRKERALMKASEASSGKKDEGPRLDLEMACTGRGRATVLPPTEQKGAVRGAEMRELYGAGAAMIQGMETAMQLTFDRNTDRHKPRPWPALPLNIQFDDASVAESQD